MRVSPSPRKEILFLSYQLYHHSHGICYSICYKLDFVKRKVRMFSVLEKTNNSDLTKQGIHEKYIFFYQRWRELLHHQTLDTHQYKIHNANSAISELIDVINLRLDGVNNTDYNIKICIEELSQLLKEDCVFQGHYPTINTYLSTLLKKKYSSGKYSFSEIVELKNSLEYNLIELQKSYFDKILTELELALDCANNVKVEKLIYLLISQCIYLGWSPQELGTVVRVFTGNKDNHEKWNSFIAILSSIDVEHDVLLSISLKPGASWVTEQDVLKSIGILIYSHDELMEYYSNEYDLSRALNAEKKYTKITQNAPDVISAAHLGIKKITTKMDLASFYNIIKPWGIDVVSIVVINKNNGFVRSLTGQQIYQTYDYVDSSNKIFENTRAIFDDDCKSEIKKRLRTTFTYVNVSRASFFQEEKFLNMWVALEALAKSNSHDSVIANVKETVSASMCLRYYYRMIRNFYEDCKRCKVNFEFSTESYDFTSDSTQQIVKRLIEILKNEALSAELTTKCEKNSLLKYRCDEIIQMIVKQTVVHDKIMRHNTRIQWQLQRLYRIRNEIAHSAFHAESPLVIYIEHLYDYLACLITEIVMCKNIDDLSSMEQIFSVINDNYSFYKSEGKNTDIDRVSDFYNTGIMNFLP